MRSLKFAAVLISMLAGQVALACPAAPFFIKRGEVKLAKVQGNKLLSPDEVEFTPNQYWRETFEKDDLKLERAYKIDTDNGYYLLFQVKSDEEPTIRWFVYREAGFFEGFVGNPYVIYTDSRSPGRGPAEIVEEEQPDGTVWNRVNCQ